MDKFNREKRSKIMKAVKSRGSNIETTLQKSLWHRGYRYIKNDPKVYGKPDVCFRGLKVAIFCDSAFWHGKDWREDSIKSNKEYWNEKIKRNIARDKKVNLQLKNNGWIVIRFWENDLTKNLSNCVENVIKVVEMRKANHQ